MARSSSALPIRRARSARENRAWGAVEKLVVNEVEQNLRFQGQYFDVETGLHYNTFRYYDPEIGRFITQDPIG
ncbi:RHS repeat-associated core domain-containing protein, partial [Pseudomonas savastanoi]|uniref:RHS repeat-associated core domain-containing protein n=1 Tax=Pseudomonas savastanoi TaxID=29438 RepID=UPI0030796A47